MQEKDAVTDFGDHPHRTELEQWASSRDWQCLEAYAMKRRCGGEPIHAVISQGGCQKMGRSDIWGNKNWWGRSKQLQKIYFSFIIWSGNSAALCRPSLEKLRRFNWKGKSRKHLIEAGWFIQDRPADQIGTATGNGILQKIVESLEHSQADVAS